MKSLFKIFCSIMSSVFLFTLMMPVSYASDWNRSWKKHLDEGKGVSVAPGNDDTEVYITWYGGKDGVAPVVKVSTKKDMSDAKAFEGSIHSNEKIERANHVTVTGLEKGKTYYYVCSDGTTDTKVESFKTVAENSAFSAVYVSDIHISGESYEDAYLEATAREFDNVLNEATSKADISLILSGGDQATEGRPCEYFAMVAPDELRKIPTSIAVGNHDVKRYTFSALANYPNLKTDNKSESLICSDYYFVKGNALFLVIDSTNSSAADHYEFVRDAVEANPDVMWRVMMFHHDLYGGHIESREAENKLLKLLFTPIIDEFQIDICLMGHSHCYSQSHIIYSRVISEEITKNAKITDPKGTVYFSSGTLTPDEAEKSGEPIVFDSDYKSEFIATDCLAHDESIYSILDFTEKTLTVKSYIKGNKEAFNSLEITKTSQQGGHPEEKAPMWFSVGKYLGTIYNWINNISRNGEIKERG
ncbi:MAG: fibronectin type III domain-containing protein [Clostridia bacterium]|nr:fibronectin type III domain-containing protein [Clostridia bacterium]